MDWSLTPRRRDEPELMDAPGLPASEVAAAYRVLARVNRQLGHRRTMKRELRRFLDEEEYPRAGRVTLLDLGSGSGDIPGSLSGVFEGRGAAGLAVALDRDPTAAALARREGLHVVRGDALRLPLAAASVDVVTAVKFAHHFDATALAGLVAEMTRVARRRVIVLDIRRHWVAYWGFVAWSRLWTRNRLVRYDGPLSVLRGFTAGELMAATALLGRFEWTVRSYAGFQLALVGRRLPGGADQIPGNPASPSAAATP
jgi:ubiquinone/menaquinone biosynthesis C-methylase UbiE